MKIAFPAEGPALDACISGRFGTAVFLLIVDLENGNVETIPCIATSGERGAGIKLISMAIARGAQVVITGFCSPAVCDQLEAADIKVITGVEGTVGDAVERYRKGLLGPGESIKDQVAKKHVPFVSAMLFPALAQAGRQFINLLPVMLGVVFLIGLFNTFVSADILARIFSGAGFLDTILGACFGSLFAGNPVNSYIIGAQLLDYGISLFAVTAFILAWVTVGLVQLPAEIAAFGTRFALVRNGFSFIIAILIALIMVWFLRLTGVVLS